MLTFKFTGVDGSMIQCEKLTSGMVGKEVKFEFSSDWDSLDKTAVFTAGGVTKDVIDVQDTAVIPPEVLAKPWGRLYVGIYGVGKDGALVIPTIMASGPTIMAGADPSGDEGANPSLPVWAQLQQQIDALKGEGTGDSIIVDDEGYLTTVSGGFKIDDEGYIIL